uniref:Uncharacterized protein n=1 Tax=Rhizophora mucronata TaxID=61149 RepID=A0A2P2JVA8_RHIMU
MTMYVPVVSFSTLLFVICEFGLKQGMKVFQN